MKNLGHWAGFVSLALLFMVARRNASKIILLLIRDEKRREGHRAHKGCIIWPQCYEFLVQQSAF